MLIHGNGQLQHHFWGNYHATIAIGFDTTRHAALAVEVLGAGWRVGGKGGDVAYGTFTGAAYEAAEAKLVGFGADLKKLTSIAKSIDFGEPFKVAIEVVNPDQLTLPGV